MARISSHVSENELDHSVNWRFSLENIREANDKVLMLVIALGMYHPYLLLGVLLYFFLKSPTFNFYESTMNYIDKDYKKH